MTGVQTCALPICKSHAVIDISYFKDDIVNDSVIEIALSTEANPANLTSVDFFIDDVEMIGASNTAELSKVLVGKGERLYLRVIAGANVNVRVSGVEETNSKVLKAGRLGANSIPGTSQTQIFNNATNGAAYISGSVTIYNSSATNSAEVEMWITSDVTPAAIDKILKITVPTKDTTVIENIFLSPNDKIFVRSSQGNSEYFVNGVVVGV